MAIEREDLSVGEDIRTNFLQCSNTITKYDFTGPVSFHAYLGSFKSGWTDFMRVAVWGSWSVVPRMDLLVPLFTSVLTFHW